MKILWVRAGPFFPLDTGGRIRTWNVLRELGKLDEVTALFYMPSFLAVTLDGVQSTLAELIALQYSAPRKYSFAYALDYLHRLASPAPYSVRKNVTAQVQGHIRDLLASRRFDVVICDFLSSTLNMPARAACPQVLFAHNVETMIWKRHFQVERHPLRKLVTGVEYWKMQRFEPRQAKRFDHLITVSEVDRDWFARFLPRESISVLPTGVDVNYFCPWDAPETDGRLLFTGSMDWLPNEDAISYFVQQILPEILHVRREARLEVVGRDPTRPLQKLARENPHVKLTGWVADVRPHMAAASVYVVPLRIGGGTRLKIFEALAMGKAVVSTRIGAEGLPVRHDEHVLLADDPHDFARCVVDLLNNPELRRRLGQTGRQLVESRYSWPAVAWICHGILEKVVRSPQDAQPG